MEDFFYAGGLPALLATLSGRLHLASRTVSGRTLGEDIDGAKVFNGDVIRRSTIRYRPRSARRSSAAISRPAAR